MAYMNQQKKQRIAAALASVVPAGWKYTLAVRNHSTICMTIQAAPVDLLQHIREHGRGVGTHWRVNDHRPEGAMHGDVLETFRKIIDALNTDNHDRSDVMTDYFDVGHYVDLQIGRWDRPFVCTAPQAPAQAIAAACAARGLPADRLCVVVVS